MKNTIQVNAKTIYNFSSFVGDVRGTKPILKNVYINNKEMVATDSYKMLIIKENRNIDTPVFINFTDFAKKYKNNDSMVLTETADVKAFPDYKKVIWDTEKESKTSIEVDAKLLIETLKPFVDKNLGNNRVRISIKDDINPIILEQKEKTALLMLLKKQ